MLTKHIKTEFFLPGLLLLMLIGIAGYNWYILSEGKAVQAFIEKTHAQIRADQTTLQLFEKMNQDKKIYLYYKLDEWIPIFQNFLEAKLFFSAKVAEALKSTGALEKEWELNTPDLTTKPYLGEFCLEAVFPSYNALVEFLKAMEESVPPLLPEGAEIKKEGIKINASLTMLLAYRLKDETN